MADAVRPTGPFDPELPILAFDRPDGRPEAVLFNHSTHTIGTESVSPGSSGAMSGLIGGGGAGIGALLASFIFLITSSIFPGEAFAVWGWRCMFFSGLLSSLLGWFIFNNLEESPFFKERQKQKAAGTAVKTTAPVTALFSIRALVWVRMTLVALAPAPLTATPTLPDRPTPRDAATATVWMPACSVADTVILPMLTTFGAFSIRART